MSNKNNDTAENSCNWDRCVPFTVENMMTLLTVYDAYVELEKAISVIIGGQEAYMYDEGIIGTFSRLEELIRALSPLGKIRMKEEQDYYDTPLARYLENSEMDLRERAEQIMFSEE